MSFPQLTGPGPVPLKTIVHWFSKCENWWRLQNPFAGDTAKVAQATAAIRQDANPVWAWWDHNQATFAGTWDQFCTQLLNGTHADWRRIAIDEYYNIQQGSFDVDQYVDAFDVALNFFKRAVTSFQPVEFQAFLLVSHANEDVKRALHARLGPDTTAWAAVAAARTPPITVLDLVRAEIHSLNDNQPVPPPGVGTGTGGGGGPAPNTGLVPVPNRVGYFRSARLYGVNTPGAIAIDSSWALPPNSAQLGRLSFIWMHGQTPNVRESAPTAVRMTMNFADPPFTSFDVYEGFNPAHTTDGLQVTDPRVFLRQVAVTYGSPANVPHIAGLTFILSSGQSVTQGPRVVPTGLFQEVFTADPGFRIVGLHGTRSGDLFREIGFIVTRTQP